MKNDCVFCKIVNKDIKTVFVYEDSDIVAFDDVKPQAPVHVLIVPKKHIEEVGDIAPDEAGLMGKLLLAAKEIAQIKNLKETGYRMIVNCGSDAGQAVSHIHLHLLAGRKFAWPPG